MATVTGLLSLTCSRGREHAVAGACSWAADALVRAAPRGAYTTARTCGGRSAVFEFESHAARTASSAALMLAADRGADGGGAAARPPAFTTADALRPILLGALSDAVAAYARLVAQPPPPPPSPAPPAPPPTELKLTLVLTWGRQHVADAYGALAAAALAAPAARAAALAAAQAAAGDADAGGEPPWALVTHVTALHARRAPPIRVLVLGAPRANAAAKDSEWVRSRAALEAAKGPDTEEVLLLEGDEARLLEGTQTNFFAVEAGALHTAPEGAVLGGTVRRLVLEVAAREGIPVVLAAPRLAGARGWSAAFLTSTSRLVLPVDQLAYDPALLAPSTAQGLDPARAPPAVAGGGGAGAALDGSGGADVTTIALRSASCPLLQRLEALVASEVAAHSTPLLALR